MGWKGPGNSESIIFRVKSFEYLSGKNFLFLFCFWPSKIHIFSNSLPWLSSMELSALWFLNTIWAGFIENLASVQMTQRGFILLLLFVLMRKSQSTIPRGFKYSYHADVTKTFLSRSFTWPFERFTVRRVYKDIGWRCEQAIILKKQCEKILTWTAIIRLSRK